MRIPITLGTQPLASLKQDLRASAIRHNAYSEQLLELSIAIAEAPTPVSLEIQPLTAHGFPQGATMDELLEVATQRSLAPCSLEAAIVLRLAWLEQPQGPRITIASMRPVPSEQHPRGFYLRSDHDGLWLRGYVASDDWVFAPEELVALAVSN